MELGLRSRVGSQLWIRIRIPGQGVRSWVESWGVKSWVSTLGLGFGSMVKS